MLFERCLNTLYRSKAYDLYLGRKLPPPIATSVFDHTLSAHALWYAERVFPAQAHTDAAKAGHFRTLPILPNDVSEIGRTLGTWIIANDHFQKDTWQSDIMGERVTRWINAYPKVANAMDVAASAGWRTQIRRHARHLSRPASSDIPPWRRFLYHQGRLVSTLALDELAPTLPDRLRVFGNDVDQQILGDGGHVSRSPAISLAIFAILIEVRDALIAGHIEAPSELVSAMTVRTDS